MSQLRGIAIPLGGACAAVAIAFHKENSVFLWFCIFFVVVMIGLVAAMAWLTIRGRTRS
jgi:UDP-N-acetylmuramyl pentapeptide phosphotransferase/UDP-N-acetylglucosamine-1-phosphate transferase